MPADDVAGAASVIGWFCFIDTGINSSLNVLSARDPRRFPAVPIFNGIASLHTFPRLVQRLTFHREREKLERNLISRPKGTGNVRVNYPTDYVWKILGELWNCFFEMRTKSDGITFRYKRVNATYQVVLVIDTSSNQMHHFPFDLFILDYHRSIGNM